MWIQAAPALIAFTTLLLPAMAQAQVFRCTNAAGQTEYMDAPCAGGKGRTVEVDQNTLPGQAGREQVLKDENERLRNAQAANQRNAAADVPLGRTEADLQAERANSYECKRATRSYEVAASSIHSWRNTEPEELAMYSACGMRVPDKTVVNNVYVSGWAQPVRMARCDRRDCRDALGNQYTRGPGGSYRNARGICTLSNARLQCP
ncbi:DUF4124 domain-containing protein [uncultured Ramlibacter sp.]|uniref:DUF4124 domain-containing protein n=1 Tax=uncultured Ramlibacter sp. TaxID=260755 RepID=UPI002629E0DA|nr:DUF4124 domain-containing protein [uncultured Ramlibacter sp.]